MVEMGGLGLYVLWPKIRKLLTKKDENKQEAKSSKRKRDGTMNYFRWIRERPNKMGIIQSFPFDNRYKSVSRPVIINIIPEKKYFHKNPSITLQIMVPNQVSASGFLTLNPSDRFLLYPRRHLPHQRSSALPPRTRLSNFQFRHIDIDLRCCFRSRNGR